MLLNKSVMKFLQLTFSFVIMFQWNFAFSQTSTPNKLSIQVSNLEKTSLGSIGVKTNMNDSMGLDIWKGMTSENIIEHLNYIPDIVSSRNVQILLNDLCFK